MLSNLLFSSVRSLCTQCIIKEIIQYDGPGENTRIAPYISTMDNYTLELLLKADGMKEDLCKK